MGKAYSGSKEQTIETGSQSAPEAPNYGSNSEQAQTDSMAGLSDTPLLDAAGLGSPSPLSGAPLGLGLLGGLIGCTPSEVESAVDAAAAQSPRLAADVAKLRSGGWTFAAGTAGGGTSTNHQSKQIVVDEDDLADTAHLTSTIAHEVGHALDGPTQYQFDPSMSRQQYIDTNTRIDLEGEAHATIEELEVREAMLAKDPSNDPGITGATATDKIAAWNDYRAGTLSRTQLVDAIVNLFATREKPSTDGAVANYWDYYAMAHADAWDKSHPPTP
ncbi:MAG: hypothetical protein ABMA64_00320 [Myxococcota bacterium]